MSRPGITYVEVDNAAQQLLAGGQEPTIERIRNVLKMGSNSTIGAHLKAWRGKQGPLNQLASKDKIPEELVNMLKGLWDRVMTEAEGQVELIKKDSQQDLSQHKHIIQQLEQYNARLQQSERQLQQNGDGLMQEKLALENMVAQSRTDIASLQAKHEGLIEQCADKENHIGALNKQNQQTQANLEHYRAASLEQRHLDQQKAEQQQRELSQTVQQLKLENTSLRLQQNALQQAYKQLQSEQSNVQAELSKLSLYAQTISDKLIEVNTALAQKTESQQHWQTQYEELFAKCEEGMTMIAELKTQNAVLSEQGTAIKVMLDGAVEQNKALAHDKWMLGQEKAQLFGQLKQLQTAL